MRGFKSLIFRQSIFNTKEHTMDTYIVYLDDASYAQHLLAPMLQPNEPARWVLVACAPRMSRRIGKWLSHSARENWRAKWCDKLFMQITPLLQVKHGQQANVLEYIVASSPLPELTQRLRTQFGAARVVDARRPKFGQDLAPVSADQPAEHAARWQVSGAVGTLGVVLALASE
jgi:hypothetical protein